MKRFEGCRKFFVGCRVAWKSIKMYTKKKLFFLNVISFNFEFYNLAMIFGTLPKSIDVYAYSVRLKITGQFFYVYQDWMGALMGPYKRLTSSLQVGLAGTNQSYSDCLCQLDRGYYFYHHFFISSEAVH